MIPFPDTLLVKVLLVYIILWKMWQPELSTVVQIAPACIAPARTKEYGACDFFFKLFNLFLALLGLHCCAQTFSSCGEWGLLSRSSARALESKVQPQ